MAQEWIKPGQSEVKLNPSIPPGRSNRKARAFSAEIAHLRQQGYGCKAIHQALLDAGLALSKSTVQRELARLSRGARGASPGVAAPGFHQQKTSALPLVTAPALSVQGAADETRSSKDVVKAFFEGRITNPLLRKRS